MSKWRRRNGKWPKILSGDGECIENRQLTVCCNARVEMRKTGKELFIACEECNQIIGHIVIRELALLYTHFEDYLAKAANQRKIEARFLQGEVDEMFEIYMEKLLKFAEQAARCALREYVPAE